MPKTTPSSEEILKNDFRKFIWFVFKNVLRLPSPTRCQYDIAAYLADGPNKRFIQGFRGVGKSFLTSCYVVWRLWKNPLLKILIVSASEAAAEGNAKLIKSIIYHPAGEHLWGHLKPNADQKSSVLAFEVGPAADSPDRSPSVKALGIGGQLPSNRADIIIPDDIEVPANSDTEMQRDKLLRLTEEFESILKPDATSEIIYLGTPQTEQSAYRKLKDRGFDVRIWPARYPLAEKVARYGDTLAPMLRDDLAKDPSLSKPSSSTSGGAPTDPDRFNDLTLAGKEQGMRAAGFMLQFMLDTSLSDAERYPLKTRDLIAMDVGRHRAPVSVEWASGPDQIIKDDSLPNIGHDGDRFHRPAFISKDAFEPFTGAVMSIDPSGRGKDETAYCVTKFLKGMVYVRRWGGFKEGFTPETLEGLAKIAAEEEVNEIEVESNMGDGMFASLLQPVVSRTRPCRITDNRVFGRKEERILASLEPVMKQHRLVMDLQVIRDDLACPDLERRGLFQMTRMMDRRGALRHDDRIDVLAQSVAHWTKYLTADTTKALEAWEAKEAKKFEKEFWKGTILGDAAAKVSRGIARGQGRRVR